MVSGSDDIPASIKGLKTSKDFTLLSFPSQRFILDPFRYAELIIPILSPVSFVLDKFSTSSQHRVPPDISGSRYRIASVGAVCIPSQLKASSEHSSNSLVLPHLFVGL